MTTTATQRADVVRAVARQHRSERGPLLPVLHAVMEEFGHIDRSDLPVIADELNLSVAEVHGVVSFYTDFTTTPPPAHRLQLCRGEACQALGAEELFERTSSRAQELGEDVAVDEVFCLGNCALGPSGMIDGRLHGRLDDARIDGWTQGWL